MPKSKSWKSVLVACWEYYQKHAAGGSLHVVLDDGNIEDRFVDFSIEWAAGRHEAGPKEVDAEGLRLAELIRELSETQREKLYNHYDWYCYGAAHPSETEARRGVLARMGLTSA